MHPARNVWQHLVPGRRLGLNGIRIQRNVKLLNSPDGQGFHQNTQFSWEYVRRAY